MNYGTGHGHVLPRQDGFRARCGGPALCSECRDEYAEVHGRKYERPKALDDSATRKAEVSRVTPERWPWK